MSTSITTKIVRLIKNPTRLWPTVRWHTVHRVEAYAERRRVDRAIRELTSKTAAEYDAIRLDTLSSITGVDRQTLASFAAELRADTEFMAEYDEKLAEVVRTVSDLMPANGIVTNGAGNYAGFVHKYTQYKGYRSCLAPTSGSMGYGLPAAIAAKLTVSSPICTRPCFSNNQGNGCGTSIFG